MDELTINVLGVNELNARLGRLGRATSDLSLPMKDIGSYLTGFFSGQVFASRGRIIGEPWAPLNPRYAAYKARRYPGRPPLIRTGLMNRSFKADSGRSSVRITNTAPYFRYVQQGTGRMPARITMKLDAARQQQIVELVADYISREVNAV